MDAKTSLLLDDLCFGEGPRWHDDELWFSDMHEPAVKSVDLTGRCRTHFEVPGRPSGLGWLPDGRLLVVSMTDRKLLRREEDGGLALHADLSGLAGFDCNDMATDARGRSYVGNFGFDLHDPQAENRPAELILVTAEGEARVVARDLGFPNGTVITPDGRTLVVGESFGGRLTAFDVEEDGSLTGRRVWAPLEGAVPDGICLDAEGAIWVASPLGPEVLRVASSVSAESSSASSPRSVACRSSARHGSTHAFS
jgi:sugar lactone lactonase YvrE